MSTGLSSWKVWLENDWKIMQKFTKKNWILETLLSSRVWPESDQTTWGTVKTSFWSADTIYVTWGEWQAHPAACMGYAYLSNSLVVSLIKEAVATPIIKRIQIWCGRAGATLVKRYGYLTKCVASLIIKEIVISVERAAATLIKRCGYLTQCVAGLIIRKF